MAPPVPMPMFSPSLFGSIGVDGAALAFALLLNSSTRKRRGASNIVVLDDPHLVHDFLRRSADVLEVHVGVVVDVDHANAKVALVLNGNPAGVLGPRIRALVLLVRG
mmetsp:Transcript_31851/g.92543  ORF Transcript_31851/g.92543 Transcript_31851/m.92543 type:complete len:107 (-) Transcript_31851:1232-1552(-)